MIVEIVEANFAPGDDFGVLREAGEFVEVLLGDFFGFVRMDADGGLDPIVLLGVGDGGVEFFRARAGADGQKSRDACVASALQHGFAVVRELREVDVGVGIDQLHKEQRDDSS